MRHCAGESWSDTAGCCDSVIIACRHHGIPSAARQGCLLPTRKVDGAPQALARLKQSILPLHATTIARREVYKMTIAAFEL
jgi:hypothetical protein